MTKINWFISEEAFSDRQDSLIPYLKNNNCEVVSFNFDPIYRNYNFEENYQTLEKSMNEISIAYGPIKFIRDIQKWCSPYVFGFENSECLKYRSNLPNSWFLSDKVQYMSFGYFYRNKDEIFRKRQVDEFSRDSIFMRPNSGMKSFTGLVINEKDFEHEISCLKQIQHVDDSEIILVSDKHSILNEYRFFIIDSKVVTGTIYGWKEDLKHDNEEYEICLNLAEKVANYWWQMDKAYTIDIAYTIYGIPKIIEFNSFSSAGMYESDMNKIIESVNNLCQKLYEEQM